MIVNGHDLSYIDYFREDIPKRPGYYAKEFFGITLWPKQEMIVSAILNNRLVCVPTGHSIGKSCLASVLCPLWLLSHFPSFVVVTGADWDNVKNLVLLPMTHIVSQSKHFSEFAKPGREKWLPIPGVKWGVIGRSPTILEGASGYHGEDGTLVISDESSAMERKIFVAYQSLLTSERDAFLMLGNPLRPDGPFREAANSKRWITLHISSLETPNYIQGKEVIPGLASRVWVEEMRDMYGEGTVDWNARVLGQFPDQAEDTFIAVSLFDRPFSIPKPKPQGPKVMSVDVAFSGSGDESFWTIRDDVMVHRMEFRRGFTEAQIVGLTREMYEEFGTVAHFIDDIGLGHAIATDVKHAGVPNVVRVRGSARAHDSVNFFNARAEMWIKMRKALHTLYIPPQYKEKLREMTSIKREWTGKKQFKLEPKDKFKARIGKSPDGPDSLAMTYYAQAGDALFPMVDKQVHTVGADMSLHCEYSRWIIRRKGGIIPYGESLDSNGDLCRAIWHSRRDASYCIWVHIDEEGCWTVFRSYRSEQNLPDFIKTITGMSSDDGESHRYTWDTASAAYGSSSVADRSFIDVIRDIMDGLDSSQTPYMVGSKRLSHAAGLDEIDKMLLTTLAQFPDHDWWTESDDSIGLYESSDSMIVFADGGDVLEDLASARLRELGATADDSDDKPEEAIAGGGGFVRCLRQLCVEGACYVSS